jgi:hypothetical protein
LRGMFSQHPRAQWPTWATGARSSSPHLCLLAGFRGPLPPTDWEPPCARSPASATPAPDCAPYCTDFLAPSRGLSAPAWPCTPPTSRSGAASFRHGLTLAARRPASPPSVDGVPSVRGSIFADGWPIQGSAQRRLRPHLRETPGAELLTTQKARAQARQRQEMLAQRPRSTLPTAPSNAPSTAHHPAFHPKPGPTPTPMTRQHTHWRSVGRPHGCCVRRPAGGRSHRHLCRGLRTHRICFMQPHASVARRPPPRPAPMPCGRPSPQPGPRPMQPLAQPVAPPQARCSGPSASVQASWGTGKARSRQAAMADSGVGLRLYGTGASAHGCSKQSAANPPQHGTHVPPQNSSRTYRTSLCTTGCTPNCAPGWLPHSPPPIPPNLCLKRMGALSSKNIDRTDTLALHAHPVFLSVTSHHPPWKHSLGASRQPTSWD